MASLTLLSDRWQGRAHEPLDPFSQYDYRSFRQYNSAGLQGQLITPEEFIERVRIEQRHDPSVTTLPRPGESVRLGAG